MKSILIVANDLEIGGAERALISLLNTIDTQQYKVDLFLLKHTGNFMDMIPKNINLLPQIDEFATLGVPIKDVLRKKKFKQGFGRLIGKIKAWKFKKTNSISRKLHGYIQIILAYQGIQNQNLEYGLYMII